MRRNRVREQYWRDICRQFADSGHKVRGFCQSRGLSEASFYYWRSTLAERDAAAGPGEHPRSAPPALLPVHIAGQVTGQMEIVPAAKSADRSAELRAGELTMLLEGIDLESVRRNAMFTSPTAMAPHAATRCLYNHIMDSWAYAMT